MLDGVISFETRGERTRDACGVYRDGTTTTREVFAKVSSVSRSEFFAAGQAGFRPEYRFVVFPAEYRGENLCRYEGNLYAIYRTYQAPGSDELELYAQRETGVS